MKIKIFDYIEQLDIFIINSNYKRIANELGLNEWNEVVWIGRYFLLDNDYGEHWFDNWNERDEIEQEAVKYGIEYDDIMVIDPERFQNGKDGPTHSDELRKKFWTDVLKSLELSTEIIFKEAIKLNNEYKKIGEPHINNLDKIIKKIEKELNNSQS